MQCVCCKGFGEFPPSEMGEIKLDRIKMMIKMALFDRKWFFEEQ